MRVLIAGGGIAGLTTAIGLAQRGIASVVCERAPRERDQGSGLVMAPNALAALERLGLAERVRQVGVEPRLMMILRSDGTPLQTTATSLWRERYGRGPVAIDRSALHAILLDAARDAEVRHQAG
jgi:2-polyprenyl-6-methoxyphenol hydroxylase-like FAD-dependent oxidoreductase